MRIISGSQSGRKFNPPAKIPARPTTDIAKEGLFNTLNNFLDFEAIIALDLFSGTGNISYELASRGVGQITMVEQDRKSVQFIRQELKTLGFETQAQIIAMDVFKFLHDCSLSFDFIFADPPYALAGLVQLPDIIFENKCLNQDGIFVLEHEEHDSFERHPYFHRSKKYGMTVFSFFKNKD